MIVRCHAMSFRCLFTPFKAKLCNAMIVRRCHAMSFRCLSHHWLCQLVALTHNVTTATLILSRVLRYVSRTIIFSSPFLFLAPNISWRCEPPNISRRCAIFHNSRLLSTHALRAHPYLIEHNIRIITSLSIKSIPTQPNCNTGVTHLSFPIF
jgi:hypothetical protein